MSTTKPGIFGRSPILLLNGCYPLGSPFFISRKMEELDTGYPLPICTAIGTAREHHFTIQNDRLAILKLFRSRTMYSFFIRNQFSLPEVYRTQPCTNWTKVHCSSSI